MTARCGVANKFYVLRGEAEIRYLPTKRMLANVLTKSLGGFAFSWMSKRLMNVESKEMMKAVKGLTLVSIGGLEDPKGRADS